MSTAFRRPHAQHLRRAVREPGDPSRASPPRARGRIHGRRPRPAHRAPGVGSSPPAGCDQPRHRGRRGVRGRPADGHLRGTGRDLDRSPVPPRRLRPSGSSPRSPSGRCVADRSDLVRPHRQAFAIARGGRPGPVYIDIPRDVLDRQIERRGYVSPVPASSVRAATRGRSSGGGRAARRRRPLLVAAAASSPPPR